MFRIDACLSMFKIAQAWAKRCLILASLASDRNRNNFAFTALMSLVSMYKQTNNTNLLARIILLCVYSFTV